MKVVLCAVNSAYIHKNLAVLKLEKYLKRTVTVKEYSVNQLIGFVYADLLEEAADVYCFSAYIWNVEQVRRLAERLKKALGAVIIFGGPEAGAEPMDFLSENPFADYVIQGEGEAALSHLLDGIEKGRIEAYPGVYSQEGGYGTAPHVKELPMPYTEADLKGAENRILYYETSRGCHNNCAYCVSAKEACRLYDLDKVMAELKFLSDHGIKLVKLVDRSFNALGARSERLAQFLAEETGDTVFHLEIAPDMFSEELLAILEKAPKGKFQFEAGIQSLNEDTLQAVGRQCDNEKAFANIKKILSFGNSVLHVDIIAGLPLEDITSFQRTFNGVYALGASVMDVGFLKVLKGTPMREIAERYGIVYESSPPYEVIKTDSISAYELCEIKRVTHALDKVHNSGAFPESIRALASHFETPYVMYRAIGALLYDGMSRSKIYTHLEKAFPFIRRELILDFMASGEKKPPEGFEVIQRPHFSEQCIAFIEKHGHAYFPDLSHLHPCEAYKKLKFYAFPEGVFTASREGGAVYDITSLISG